MLVAFVNAVKVESVPLNSNKFSAAAAGGPAQPALDWPTPAH
jgi:hypothetical protein